MLILVRHGESSLNAEGRLVGRLDPSLTDVGRAQAAAAGALLGDVHEVRSSPLARTRETATLLGVEGVAVAVEDRIIELDYGDYDGLPLADVDKEAWRKWLTDASFRPPGGESLSELRTRVSPVLEELFAVGGEGARNPESNVVLVSHVSPIKAAIAWALGVDDLVAWRMRLSTGSVSRIAMGPQGPQLLSFNEVPYPD